MPHKKSQKKLEYNAEVKRLQRQAAHLNLMVQHEQREQQAAEEARLLLAEAILQHRVMFQMLLPLQRQWFEPPGGGPTPLLSESQLHSKDWPNMLLLASTTNHMLEPTLMMTGDEFKRLSLSTADEISQLLRSTVHKLLLLREVLSPERYQALLLQPDRLPPAATSAHKQPTNNTGAVKDSSPDIDMAASELLKNLQEFQAVVSSSSTQALMLLVDRRTTVYDVATMDVATGERRPPALSHYQQAAHRLRLTSRQLLQLQLVLKQYNRMARQQNLAGRQLVSISQDSFALQTSISGAASVQQSSLSTQPPGGGDDQLAQGHSSSSSSSRESAAAAEEGSDVSTEALMELMQQHLSERLDMTSVISVWVVSCLSYWQLAEFTVACWPYLPYYPVIAELSPFLTPDDTPRLTINAALSETAAKAAALADDVGYSGAHTFMQRRCDGLQAQLAWVMQEIQKQQ